MGASNIVLGHTGETAFAEAGCIVGCKESRASALKIPAAITPTRTISFPFFIYRQCLIVRSFSEIVGG